MKTKTIKKILAYNDAILEKDYKLKIKQENSEIEVTLPEEKSFFHGISFSEKVSLKRLKNGKWVKRLKAKFGAGADELFGLSELDEESDLEARDIRIIAFVEKNLHLA